MKNVRLKEPQVLLVTISEHVVMVVVTFAQALQLNSGRRSFGVQWLN